MNDNELLQYAIHRGIINLDAIQAEIKEMERQKRLDEHQGAIWQDNSGRWTTYVQGDEGKRKLVKKKSKEDLENYLVKYYEDKEEQHYILDTCLEWLNSKIEYGEIEQQSRDRYAQAARRYFTSDKIAKKPLKNVTEYDLEDYIKRTIHDKQLTARGWGNLRILINGTFKFAKKRGWTNINIRDFMDDLEISRKSFKRNTKDDGQEVFTDTEAEKIEDFITNERPDLENLGILLAFQTGLRVGELSALRPGDLQGQVLTVNKTEIKIAKDHGSDYQVRDYTKGKEGHRQVIVTDKAKELFEEIAARNPGSEYLFERNGSRIRSQVFTNRLYRMCDKLDIPRRSMHKIRKTYATRMIDAGLSEKLVQKQMGHTAIATTLQYYYRNNKDTEETQKLIQEAMGRY